MQTSASRIAKKLVISLMAIVLLTIAGIKTVVVWRNHISKANEAYVGLWSDDGWDRKQGQKVSVIEVAAALNDGADVNKRDRLGETRLMAAARSGNVACVDLLISKKTNVNLQDRDGDTALICAAERGNLGCVRSLLTHGADVNMLDRFGRTPLRRAVRSRNVACAAFLVSHGADANATDCEGGTALSCAIK